MLKSTNKLPLMRATERRRPKIPATGAPQPADRSIYAHIVPTAYTVLSSRPGAKARDERTYPFDDPRREAEIVLST
jgi:hypothetical protein